MLTVCVVATLAGCERRAASTTPSSPEPTGAIADTHARPAGDRPPPIDPAIVRDVVTALADDELRGRATLSPDIDRAAAVLSEAMRTSGVTPVGDGFVHTYAIATGARENTPTSLALTIGGRPIAVPPGSFAARSASGNGTAEGELVFVGYGTSGTTDGPAYDDLAGIDVKGRIAVVLAEAPRRAATEELVAVVRREVEAYNRDTADARASGDARAVARAHARLRKTIARVLAPQSFGEPLPATVLPVPTDPAAAIDVGAVIRPLMAARDQGKGPRFDPRQARLATKLARLREAGAIGVIVVTGPRTFVERSARERDVLPELSVTRRGGAAAGIPVIQLRWREAEAHLRIGGRRLSQIQAAIDRELRPHSQVITGARASIAVDIVPLERTAPNVLGYIPGTDLAHELVVVGGHFDHIGTPETGDCIPTTRPDGSSDTICNGADDNGSGTAAVSALAQAWGRAGLRPRRTLVFAHFSGEEIGLLGSNALAETPPAVAPFAGGKVVAMLNLDMIGRLASHGLEIGGLSSSSGWAPLIDGLDFGAHPVLLERSITTRSDHAGFYRKQVPVLFFFTGVHDDYHRPGDELAGLDVDGVVEVTRWIDAIVFGLAQGAAIPFTPAATPDEGLVGKLPGSDPPTHTRRVPVAPRSGGH